MTLRNVRIYHRHEVTSKKTRIFRTDGHTVSHSRRQSNLHLVRMSKASNRAKKNTYSSLKVSIIKFDEQITSSFKPDSLMLERREGNTSHNFILYTLQCKTIQQPIYKYLLMNKGIKHGYVNLYTVFLRKHKKKYRNTRHHAVFPYIPLLTPTIDFLLHVV